MQPDDQMIRETYRLAKENNKMLHAIRRNAFLVGFVKFIVYAILFAAPIWFYMTYISGTVDRLVNTVNQIEGTNAAAQAKLSGFEQAYQDFKAKLPGFMQGASATTSQ